MAIELIPKQVRKHVGLRCLLQRETFWFHSTKATFFPVYIEDIDVYLCFLKCTSVPQASLDEHGIRKYYWILICFIKILWNYILCFLLCEVWSSFWVSPWWHFRVHLVTRVKCRVLGANHILSIFCHITYHANKSFGGFKCYTFSVLTVPTHQAISQVTLSHELIVLFIIPALIFYFLCPDEVSS